MQQVLKAPSVFGGDFSSVNIFRECFNPPNRVFDFRTYLRRRRKRRVSQPVMTNHSLLCRISDCSRLQLSHRRKCMLDLRPHFFEQIVRKFHTTDVERKAELTVFHEISLKSLPK